MQNSFINVPKNRFDRNFGGTNAGVADPYVSGYHFIYFKNIPSWLPDMCPDFGDVKEIQGFLSGGCLAVTPPGGTLNSAEFTGLGGTKWGVPTNFDYGNTLTIRFVEFSGLPVLQIFHNWVRGIRSYRYGISDAMAGNNYHKTNYSSTVLYWTTKPDGVTIEYYAAYTGVYPTKDPQDSYTGDLTAVDKLELDMEFRLDYPWHESWVKKECQSLAFTFAGESTTKFTGIPSGESIG